MSQLTAEAARILAANFRIPLNVDFHALPSAEVERVILAADAWKYRHPKNANGSRARYFHAYLVRTAARAN